MFGTKKSTKKSGASQDVVFRFLICSIALISFSLGLGAHQYASAHNVQHAFLAMVLYLVVLWAVLNIKEIGQLLLDIKRSEKDSWPAWATFKNLTIAALVAAVMVYEWPAVTEIKVGGWTLGGMLALLVLIVYGVIKWDSSLVPKDHEG